VTAVAGLIGSVHAVTRSPDLAELFRNDEMRRLHGEHIFQLPFRANDFPLPPAVRRRAEEMHADRQLVALADAAWRRYLEPRGALLHGDVQAGNVLLHATGAKLLDAEIAHVGDPAFDVGTLLAHLVLPAIARGELATVPARELWSSYTAACDAPPPFEEVARIAGFEVMRRTIGAARVAAVEQERDALEAIDLALDLIRDPSKTPAAFEAGLAARRTKGGR
jgi:5-methylthioribose kinase